MLISIKKKPLAIAARTAIASKSRKVTLRRFIKVASLSRLPDASHTQEAYCSPPWYVCFLESIEPIIHMIEAALYHLGSWENLFHRLYKFLYVIVGEHINFLVDNL
jgi:hypothetical protein